MSRHSLWTAGSSLAMRTFPSRRWSVFISSPRIGTLSDCWIARVSRPPPAHVLSVRSAVWRTGRMADIRRHPGSICKCVATPDRASDQCSCGVPRTRPRPCGKICHPPHRPRSLSVPGICRESRLPGIGNPAAQRRSVILNLNRRRIPYLSCRGRRVDKSVEESRSQFKTGGGGHWTRARTARPGGGDHQQPPKPGSCRHVSIDQNVSETVEVWKTATTKMWTHTCKKHLT